MEKRLESSNSEVRRAGPIRRLLAVLKPERPRPLYEGVWARACVDAFSLERGREFVWQCLLAFVVLIVALLIGSEVLIENAGLAILFLLGTGVLSLTLRFLWSLFRASYRQRDEARALLGERAVNPAIVRTVRQMLTVAVDELSSQFPPGAQSVSPHLPTRVGKLVSLINCSLKEGSKRRTLAAAVSSWVPKYEATNHRLDIHAFGEATRAVNAAIAAIQSEDVNPDHVAPGDTWPTWVPPATPRASAARTTADA